METQETIHVKGARVHNLKNIEVKIPRNRLIVITGLSGSGKSTLAFDTVFAEGQRRYVESLSAYARQFLGRINKPDVDFITGIPPAIAIEQKVNTRSPRSTVGTSTEIYNFLKLLYTRVGRTFSPVTGKEVKHHTVTDVVNFIAGLPEGMKLYILSPLCLAKEMGLVEKLTLLQNDGFTRLEIAGKIISIEELLPKVDAYRDAPVRLLIDRIAATNDADMLSRIADSVQTAFAAGDGTCFVEEPQERSPLRRVLKRTASHLNGQTAQTFSSRFEADGITFEEPTEHLFSFNNPLGACPRCEGSGKTLGIDENMVIPNRSLSVYNDAVACWRGGATKEHKEKLIYLAKTFNFPVHKPYADLTDEQKDLLWNGNACFCGINGFFHMLESNRHKIQYRVMLSRYTGRTTCPECKGLRLRKEATYVRIGGKSICDLTQMTVENLFTFFQQLTLTGYEQKVAARILLEIRSRLQFLLDVGLGYLTLHRLSNTLSGGESQRINLATSLGGGLVGSLYILDEPSIGLHPRDTQRLIKVLKQLRDLGNTVVVVEHDEEIIRAADEIIDIGPLSGRHGGEVVFHGLPAAGKNLPAAGKSLTIDYLTGAEKIDVPAQRRRLNNHIEVIGARENNLKHINVRFPLHGLVAVTGVSGSGKSSLVKNILYPSLAVHTGQYSNERAGLYECLKGDLKFIKAVEMIDQEPIGRSSRSNPVTYVKAFDDIRKLFAEQPYAKTNGYDASYFSFNMGNGRCEACQGEGIIKVEMQFMADVNLVCEACGGKRYKPDILEVRYKGYNIAEVLDMTVNEAIEFFDAQGKATPKRLSSRLIPLQQVGLGYIKLGQPSNTLSGGESQRLKLASFLSKETSAASIFFIFDEPTTGLHFHDVKKLLEVFQSLISQGHSIVVVEHNMDVVKNADWVIELGPDSGEHGGELVFEGTPEQLLLNHSHTGEALRKLRGRS
ncbi:MAG: excinuclease ABC subunit UvrA [Prevotellaceae bacterium]|nr:excinuclease ABC subunit UvrA [Prevotellaceae bacterium]